MFLQNDEEEIPPIPPEVWDTVGEPSGNFNFMVGYTAPESSKIRIKDIQPTGWDDPPEYLSQPEESYTSSLYHHQFEIPNENLCFNTPAEVVRPDFDYHQGNTISGEDQEDNSGNDLESVSDNESLHPEDWEVHPENPEYMPPENAYTAFYTPRPVNQAEEDRFSSTKGKVNRPESSKPVRPTINVNTENYSKGKLPEYIVFQGVRHYWKAVEVQTVVHRPK